MVTAQLIRVSDETHPWAQSYERGPHDVLEVQAEVARAVAREIQIKLTPHSSAAWTAIRRGRSIRRRTTSFAAAYDGISDALTMLACRGMTPASESFHKAKAATKQAVRLQPELGEGYGSLAHVRLHDCRNHAEKDRPFEEFLISACFCTPKHTPGTRAECLAR